MQNRRVRIGLVQSCVGENPRENLEKTEVMIREAAAAGARIVCLQELFSAPYFPQYHRSDALIYAETIPGPTTATLAGLARESGVVIIVPVFEKSREGRYYNSAAVCTPDGSVQTTYRKVHIPQDPLYYEQEYFEPGNGYMVADTPFGRIAVLICFDQWFPEAARAVTLQGADIIFYPTAIGYIRGMEEPSEGDWHASWEMVQRGHAIANGIHIAAVNRVGTEGDLIFFGGSFVCDAFGNVLARAGDGEEVLVTDVDLGMNERVREGWGFLRNRRPDTYGALIRTPRTGLSGTPHHAGYRMPAEWEPHQGIWLAWPWENGTFSDLPSVERSYVEMIMALEGRERVHLLVRDREMRSRAGSCLKEAGADPGQVRFYLYPYADVWFRDYGPNFLVHRTAPLLTMVDWRFNAWGEKYEGLLSDDRIPSFISEALNIPSYSTDMVLEGGSIDVNGKGMALTTEQCLLHENRNPSLSREDIERMLEGYLGVSRVVWLKGGIAGDDTDGHIDDVARFVDERTVVCALADDSDDDNFSILQENYRILSGASDREGNPLRVVPLPLPGAMTEGEPLPASYTNFYIGNGTVLVPIFRDPADAQALRTLAGVFPGRRVVGIDCRAMIEGMGAVHCVSQQFPAA